MSATSFPLVSGSLGNADVPKIATLTDGTHTHIPQAMTVDEKDELENTDNEVKPKRKSESGRRHASERQVVNRRDFTLPDFVKELRNYKKMPSQWKTIVEMVRFSLSSATFPLRYYSYQPCERCVRLNRKCELGRVKCKSCNKDHRDCALTLQYARWRFATVFLVPDNEFQDLYNAAEKEGLLNQKNKIAKKRDRKQSSSVSFSVNEVDEEKQSGAISNAPSVTVETSVYHLVTSDHVSSPPPPSTTHMDSSIMDDLQDEESLANTREHRIADLQEEISLLERTNADQKEKLREMQREIFHCIVSTTTFISNFIVIVGEFDQNTIAGQNVSSQIARLYMHIGHIGESLAPFAEMESASPQIRPLLQNVRDAYGAWGRASATIGELSRQCSAASVPFRNEHVNLTVSVPVQHEGEYTYYGADTSRKRSRRA
jgi:hypothetical protein